MQGRWLSVVQNVQLRGTIPHSTDSRGASRGSLRGGCEHSQWLGGNEERGAQPAGRQRVSVQRYVRQKKQHVYPSVPSPRSTLHGQPGLEIVTGCALACRRAAHRNCPMPANGLACTARVTELKSKRQLAETRPGGNRGVVHNPLHHCGVSELIYCSDWPAS